MTRINADFGGINASRGLVYPPLGDTMAVNMQLLYTLIIEEVKIWMRNLDEQIIRL